MNKGRITRIIGPIIDVQFEKELPAINNALEIKKGETVLVAEVQKHLGSGAVRAVAMGSTDGLARGVEVKDTGRPISVPVGPQTLGRMFNVLGEAIDGQENPVVEKMWPIHR